MSYSIKRAILHILPIAAIIALAGCNPAGNDEGGTTMVGTAGTSGASSVERNVKPMPSNFGAAKGQNVKVDPPVPAYDFLLTDLDGKPLGLTDYRGSWVFVDFWATW